MDDMTCPQCGTRMRYDFEREMIMCPECHYSPLEARRAEIQAEGPRPRVQFTHRGEINRSALAAFNSGWDYLHDGDKARALESFERALYFQSDFADAHIAIADLVDDEQTRRDHLGIVVAYDGGNLEAMRRLMVLDGRLTPEQAARTYHYRDQRVQPVESVEAPDPQALLCPECGGLLTVDDASGRVECRSCGHVELRQPSREVGEDLLAMAMLERKATPVRWVVGERILHCNQCGAERTIPARNLTHRCPFCGSQQVVQQEPAEALEQPDGLVPFKIARQEAAASIKAELKRARYRIANLFDRNEIASGVIEPVYLPFWLFDVVTDVTVTRTYTGSDRDILSRVQQGVQSSETFTDALFNLPICGVTSPSSRLTGRLGSFDYDAMVAYQPELLAKYPAQLYSLDFDKASLDARGLVSQTMRDKHGRRDAGEDQVRITVTSMAKNMSFRLLLLPVWVASLIEVDDDTRAALVNGQTGKVVLGPSQKRTQ